ncbi:dedicator of cytokinesis protein myoblast city isoform X3 [Rhodnius prolixus]|uniref:dedicator of cytokinesis protein myoblast city isoform X3 n=1 Tax=Rhodnius prolixus TaxID=13249 RepID=UPI003D18F12A
MTISWTNVKDTDRFGIVIHNFWQPGAHRLKLTLGDGVRILKEHSSGWYYGYSMQNKNLHGIFPKSYVHLRDCIIDKYGPTEEVVLKQPYVVQEITSVLREWGVILKRLYVTNSEHFRPIKAKMYDLMRYRSQIISGKFPVDQLKQIKKTVTSRIDVGNKLLNLDMVVRDDQGNILNPEVTSTVELYKHHHLATERITRAMSESSSSISDDKRTSIAVTSYPLSQQHCSHCLSVRLMEISCRLQEPLQLLVCLYDGKEERRYTETHLIRQTPHRLIFTDLGSRDMAREKVYLVIYIVRVGSMERSTTSSTPSTNNNIIKSILEPVRRPYGVAAKDITLIVNGKLQPTDEDSVTLPLLLCEKDNLEGTLKRLFTIKDLTHKDHKGQTISVRLKMLQGDLKQVREENPHLVIGQVSIARKMDFPEVILPGDVRNDLYVTLVSGEFSRGSKSTDRNVQVSLSVCNSSGQTLPGVVHFGGEENDYRSVVYYHEDKPRWVESVKVAVPIDDFKVSHLRFTFKHRSSNETKDKNEKPFALSFVKLMQDNGTTLPDTTHDLLVYKVDHKKYDPNDVSYLYLPSTRTELKDGIKQSAPGLTLSNKDVFVIQTNVCSTKLTQNIDLLSLLNWVSNEDKLEESLLAVCKVSGEEIVKFLQDVLDSLFNILQTSTSYTLDDTVFSCLLYIIGLVSDRKYEHFQPVLDLYIKESFCATLAYNKLIAVLKEHIENANSPDREEREILLKTMKSLQYIIKFIVRSRILFSELNGGKDEEEFATSLKNMLISTSALMVYNTDSTLVVQAASLKYLPTTIPDLVQVFSPLLLSELLCQMVNNVPQQRLTKQKMMTLSDLVHSPLFLHSDCRQVLLPVIFGHIKDLLEAKDESCLKHVELCVNILSDIMELLFRDDIGTTVLDLTITMHGILRTVIQSTIAMDRESTLVGNLVAVMLDILRQMGPKHFDDYINRFPTSTDLLDFLMEILLVFKDLISRPVYAKDWTEMILLQNSIILKSLRYFSHTIRDYYFQMFEHQAWNNFFHCAISFLTQPALQLESFSPAKARRIVARYKDMRMETGFEIKSMWFNLGQHKRHFIPGMVGPFLEMTLIPEVELRKATLPIFFDMMQCEFYSSKDSRDSRRDSTHIKANFNDFENEMISKLDNLVEGGRGDEDYKNLFYETVGVLCSNHSTLKDSGVRFVRTVTRLMERLLEYRLVMNDESKENKMSCTVNLLDFYSEISRKEMYIRYLNKLCALHLECDNFTEAAYTLKLHSKLLSWSDNPLSSLLRSSNYPLCTTHRSLKEALYYDIITYFDKGKMWECAVEVCKELAKQYDEMTHDYHRMSIILRRMADYYDKIITKLRPDPEYFRVAYYGRGFPPFLQNKVFVYRGKEYERLSDFCTRTLNQLPTAELMNTLTPPGEDITESNGQYVQINHVEPIMDEKKQRSMSGRNASSQVLKYHRVNNVQKFRFSRPYHKRDSASEENEFATLWVERNVLVTSYPLPGILRWFPVASTQTYHLSPIAYAVETMQTTNESLKELILEHKNDPHQNLNPFTMRLNGILDPAVMGGITNYEKAFFTPEYLERHPDQEAQVAKLKELIAVQIPLLEVGVKTHGDLAPPSLTPLQQRLEQCFSQMQAHVIANYGPIKSCDIRYEPVTLRRQTVSPATNGNDTNRLSSTSFGSTDGATERTSTSGSGRSRVSSLTRSQVASLKTFVHLATMSPSSTLSRAGSVYVRSVSQTPSSLSLGASGTWTTSRKEKKKKRRHSNKDRDNGEIQQAIGQARPSSQWYTSPPPPPPPPPPPQLHVSASSSLASSVSSTPTSSLIFTDNEPSTPIFELRQQLTPSRPLRSEVERERRLSRPPSGHFHSKLSLPATNGNRDSIGTTDSTASEEDPPPLPLKTREADYCNLSDDSTPHSPQTPLTPRVRNKPVPPVPVEVTQQPPTPPPKRPGLKATLSQESPPSPT